MVRPLTVTPHVMRRIEDAVKAADAAECLGLLASAPGSESVTSMEMLETRASRTSAEACPIAVKNGVDALTARGLVARGIWHSHGHMNVFHSRIDVATVHRLLPAMAAATWERGAAVTTPVLEGPDAALLPLADGRLLAFTLAAEPVPDSDLLQPVRWSDVRLTCADAGGEPSAHVGAGQVHLKGHGVALHLRFPEWARVETRVVDRAFARLARLYSLVVNTRRQQHAQCLTVINLADDSFSCLAECGIVVAGDDGRDGIESERG